MEATSVITIKEYEIVITYQDEGDYTERVLSYRVRNTTAEKCVLDASYRVLNLEKQGAEINYVNIEFVYAFEE